MKVGPYGSLTEMVQATPHFGSAELKMFQDAARTIVDQAETVVLSGLHESPAALEGARDMRDLQQALRAGFPVVLHDNGSRELKAKLPMDLYDTVSMANDCMPLYLSLTMSSIPPAVADMLVAPRDSGTVTVVCLSATERAMGRLEDIRNSIDRALVPEGQ